MKKLCSSLVLITALATSMCSADYAQTKPSSAAAKPVPGIEERVQKVFEHNCARCHNPPQGFSPRISATIVMHMRVRANLSQKDEQDLLRFFNP